MIGTRSGGYTTLIPYNTGNGPMVYFNW